MHFFGIIGCAQVGVWLLCCIKRFPLACRTISLSHSCEAGHIEAHMTFPDFTPRSNKGVRPLPCAILVFASQAFGE